MPSKLLTQLSHQKPKRFILNRLWQMCNFEGEKQIAAASDERRHNLKHAIVRHAHDDILSYEWLLELARFNSPDSKFEILFEDLLAVLKDLIINRKICVGSAGDHQAIDAWQGTSFEIVSKLEVLVRSTGEPVNDREYFSFWVGMQEQKDEK